VKPWFLRDSPSFQLVPELSPLPSEAIFDKITMSAFEGTPLDIALRDCGINAIAIVGVAMEIGIEPTVRHAADLGYQQPPLSAPCFSGWRVKKAFLVWGWGRVGLWDSCPLDISRLI
jgi:nicotinamidase-related amidase